MSSSSHHLEIHRPPKEDGGHPELEIQHGEGTVSIDKGIVPLIMTMWDAGIDTLFCCEGWEVPDGEDNTAWEWQLYRAYILMPWTDEAFDWTQKLLKSFQAFDTTSPTRWEISFDYNDEHGPRICMRFPKSDIGKLLEWFGWKRKTLEELLK